MARALYDCRYYSSHSAGTQWSWNIIPISKCLVLKQLWGSQLCYYHMLSAVCVNLNQNKDLLEIFPFHGNSCEKCVIWRLELRVQVRVSEEYAREFRKLIISRGIFKPSRISTMELFFAKILNGCEKKAVKKENTFNKKRKKKGLNMFKVYNNNTRTTSLTWLLLTLNIFHTFF